MSYFLTIYSSHGLVRSAWEPEGPLTIFLAADDAPVASLRTFAVDEVVGSEGVWNSMLSTTLTWLIEDSPGIEIHGYSVGRRQSWSLSDFLDAKKAS